MNIHQDVQSVAADSNGNVTVVLSSPSGFTVGQFVTLEPTNPSLNICIGSGIVTAVSGDQFTFTGVGTDTKCKQCFHHLNGRHRIPTASQLRQ